VYLIGLTGGIASGKSTVARRLYEHGAVHIDADQVARRVVEPGKPAYQAVVEAFGPEIVRPDGRIDRERLGGIVFHDDAARAKLNGIVHPAVRELSRRLIADAERENPDAVVVYDVPLLVEASVDHPFDLVVVTSAGRKEQVKRLVEERGMDPIHAEARVDSQVGDDERRKIADVVIDTSGTVGHTVSQTDALWARIAEERRERGASRA
jgi:dephospho-CoA kinase